MLPDDGLLSDLLSALTATGAEFAEVYAQRTTSCRLSHERGGLAEAHEGLLEGVGLRLLSGGRVLYGSVASSDPDRLLAHARAMASRLGGKPVRPAPLALRPPRCPTPVAVPPDTVAFEEKAALAAEAEAAALAQDPRVTRSSILYRDAITDVCVANSEGLFAKDRRTSVTLYQQATALEGGRTRTGARIRSSAAGFGTLRELGPDRLAKDAVLAALHLLGAGPAPAGDLPVVFAPPAGGLLLHEAVGHAFEGDLVAKGLSPLAGRAGRRVAPAGVTLVDDGAAPALLGTAGFDDEGHPTGRAVLVEDGVLRGFLTDRLSAAELGAPRSGHGRRESYRHPPLPRMANTLLIPGDGSAQDVLAGVEFGLLVVRMGAGRVDVPKGGFEFSVTEGYLIRNGLVTDPVAGARVAGNGLSVLAGLERMGSDLAYGAGTCARDGQSVSVGDGSPTFLAGRLAVTPVRD